MTKKSKDNTSDHKNEIDAHSGVETTGHDWDGIKELNNPAPRWWLWVFFVCCIWSFGYWVLYPAWPTLSGHTQGILGWTQYTKLHDEQSEISARRSAYSQRLQGKSLEEIMNEPDLYAFAIAGGKTMFKENCAACHGTGAQGGKGYPNLNDDDWLWGGDIQAIYQTIKFGVRSAHAETRTSQMPAFGKEKLLKPDEIQSVADYVLSLSGASAKTTKGASLYEENCAACHGDNGKGNRDMGAPNLTDTIWLYGGTKEQIIQQIHAPKHGVMPMWDTRLSEDTIKQLSIYVHSLGGGENKK